MLGGMETTLTVQEHLASPQGIAAVAGWVKSFPEGSRGALARHLCEELDLRDPRGRPQMGSVQKALRVLEAQGLWRLPEPKGRGSEAWNPRRLDGSVPVAEGVPERVGAIRGLKLIEVSGEEDELFRIWNELMLSEHPLQDCRLVGRQVRYLIGSDHGWLGGLGFGSCALRLGVRDEWIGWDEGTRKRFQERVINLNRFLIRPSVSCENLASRALSLGMARVGSDYLERYGIEPWLAETFVDRERYAGTCFQAGNWIHVGSTKGRGRSAPNRPVKRRKDIYLYPLRPDWRGAMGLAGPAEAVPVVDLAGALRSEHWVEDEFGGAEFGHRATERRLVEIARRKAESPAAPYTQSVDGNRHELKAFYRFIGNEREEITPDTMLAPHRERTIGRMKAEKRVLVIQDSTDLDFSDRLDCNGLGVIGTNQTGAESGGLRMHSALALSEKGLPLGVLSTEFYPPRTGGKQPQDRPIEEKESYRWLKVFEQLADIRPALGQTEVVCVGDRESDIFELFDLQRRRARSVHLLVRANYSRRLKDEPLKLFEHVKALPVMGRAEVEVPRQRAKKGKPSRPGRVALPTRKAKVELKWGKVTVAPPQWGQTRHLQPMDLYAVEVREPHPPRGAKGLRWLLLTTLPIESLKQALRCVRSYSLRWRIEEWHRLLKSGCGIESHQHHTAERLSRAIAIDTVIGWRVMLLTLLGREVPDLPCELVFSPWECRLLATLQPRVAPETISGDGSKKNSRSGLRISSSDAWEGRSAEVPTNHPDIRPSCED
jgi:hypothetical protein